MALLSALGVSENIVSSAWSNAPEVENEVFFIAVDVVAKA